MEIIKSIKNIIVINLILSFAYLWALFGVAFNDTGVMYNSVFEALPTIIFGIFPLTLGSIILGITFYKKEKMNLPFYIIVQGLIIAYEIVYYIDNYVPSYKIFG